MYLYRTFIILDTTKFSNLSQSEKEQHAINKIDFEINYKSSTVDINEVVLVSNTFIVDKIYTEFKALVAGEWDEVNIITKNSIYELNILSDSSL